MIQSQEMYWCVCEDCGATTEPEYTKKDAIEAARRDGWQIEGDGPAVVDDPNGYIATWCRKHREAADHLCVFETRGSNATNKD
jgi:hypothetical protein